VRVRRAIVILVGLSMSIGVSPYGACAQSPPFPTVRRVLLINVDGFHALDLVNFVRSHPDSALAQLSGVGVTYTQAFTPKPSESLQGLLSMVTGGSSISTGIWHEVAYDRALSPPGSNCKTVGTVVEWAGNLDKNRRALDAGGGLDPSKLPLDPSKGCVPLYPHSFLRVNTIFEVIHSSGKRTAWIDKHPAYEMVSGPSGRGVTDLYMPEVSSKSVPRGTAKDPRVYEEYDDIKVHALLNEIEGKDHTGKESVGVPTICGMSFQAVSQAQEIEGYTDASGTPSPALLHSISHTDESISKMVSALKAGGLYDSTLIIITGKYGTSPIDRGQRRLVDATSFLNLINQVRSDLVAYFDADGVENEASIWLTDPSQTGKVAEILSQPANQSAASIQQILWGESLKLRYNDPSQDGRVPDIVIVPNLGKIYAGSGGIVRAEKMLLTHAGFNDDDTNVELLLSSPKLRRTLIKTPVLTTQIAPTILRALGLDPQSLQAVRIEGTSVLPGLVPERNSRVRARSSQ
jgi:hypothetical protein